MFINRDRKLIGSIIHYLKLSTKIQLLELQEKTIESIFENSDMEQLIVKELE